LISSKVDFRVAGADRESLQPEETGLRGIWEQLMPPNPTPRGDLPRGAIPTQEKRSGGNAAEVLEVLCLSDR